MRCDACLNARAFSMAMASVHEGAAGDAAEGLLYLLPCSSAEEDETAPSEGNTQANVQQYYGRVLLLCKHHFKFNTKFKDARHIILFAQCLAFHMHHFRDVQVPTEIAHLCARTSQQS